MGLDEVYELPFHAVQTSNNEGHEKQNKTISSYCICLYALEINNKNNILATVMTKITFIMNKSASFNSQFEQHYLV